MELNSKIIKSIFEALIEILLPSRCFGCQAKYQILCSNCLNNAQKSEREANNQIIALFDYHDPLIKRIIWSLKYHHLKALGIRLGQFLYENLLEYISEIREYTKGQKIIVIPVPISKKRFRIRGYNQALVIASGFCKSDKEEIFELRNDIVIKKIKTIPQARIKNRKDRLKNIRGAFAIKNQKKIKNRVIFVIDDVTTTGGTINEIIKILKKAKAKKVIGLAIAH